MKESLKNKKEIISSTIYTPFGEQAERVKQTMWSSKNSKNKNKTYIDITESSINVCMHLTVCPWGLSK